jgi:menaquinone-9 beta-reductase
MPAPRESFGSAQRTSAAAAGRESWAVLDPAERAGAGADSWDLVVVGGGPAGATVAREVAAAGHRVLLLDRREFPREKTCGDGLLPDAVRALQRAGVWGELRPRAHFCDAARFYSPSGHQVEIAGDFFTIERSVLDAALVRAARARGAEIRRAHVTRLEPQPGPGVRLRLADDASVRARIAVVATGADVSLLLPLGMVERSAPSAFAVRRYLRSSIELEPMVFSFERASLPGYGWIFPLGGRRYNLGCGLFTHRSAEAPNARELFRRFVSGSPLARQMVEAGEFISPLRGARLRCGLTGTAAKGPGPVLAVGEAVGATFPFSGEGIGKAIETGEAAAEAIQRQLAQPRVDVLVAYPQALRRLRPLYDGYQITERWLARQWVADLLVRRTSRSRFLRDAIAGIVAETVNPREVFSLRAMTRSLWS